MKRAIRLLAVTALLQMLAVPFAALADDQVPTESEVTQAEGEPPLIPHAISDADTCSECLKCHETGVKGAPMTSHPERKSCTQCHVAGAVKKKGRKKTGGR